MRERRPGSVKAWVLAALVLSLAGGGWAQAQEAPAAAAAAGEPSLPGVDLSPLNATQKATAMKIFREQHCDCSCGFTIADCRIKDSSCGRSPKMAAQVVELLAQGKNADEVVKTVFTKAAAPAGAAPGAAPAEMVFEVPAGDSYDIGPDTAPVTLITWLDYQ